MSDIFDHAFDAFQDGLDDMDQISLFSDNHVNEMRYGRSKKEHRGSTLEEMSLLFTADQYQTQTEKAICFKVANKDVWLPKSQIKIGKRDGGIYEIMCPMWLIEKHNLEDECLE